MKPPETPPEPKLTTGQTRAVTVLSWFFLLLIFLFALGVAIPAVVGVWRFWMG